MKWIAVGLLAWLALSIIVGLAFGRMMRMSEPEE